MRKSLELARVLVVDDELSSRLTLQTLLEAGGDSVDVAGWGGGGLSQAGPGPNPQGPGRGRGGVRRGRGGIGGRGLLEAGPGQIRTGPERSGGGIAASRPAGAFVCPGEAISARYGVGDSL